MRPKYLLLFLVAFMLYNDGIQTVINMATIYGKEELNLTTTSLMLTLLTIQAIQNRDFPLVQAAVLMVSVVFIFVNLSVDLLYAYLDPRIRYD